MCPVYEYRCKACGATQEHIQTLVEGEIFLKRARCEKAVDTGNCSAARCDGVFERIISRTNFSLKGGGWFSDSYK